MIKYLGIIPARLGSKRIYQKNLKPLNGKPLVQWTLEAASKSKMLDSVYISSDSHEIIELATGSFGATCFGPRSANLALDTTSTFDVVADILSQYEAKGLQVENIVLLQPTSPLRTEKDIDQAILQFEKSGRLPLQSYSEAECPPQWLFKLDESGRPIREEDSKNLRSQDLGKYFRINGAIYIIPTKKLLSSRSFSPTESVAYIMPRETGLDIDEQFDFEMAEFLMRRREAP
jgi:CMP-N-acetylneuraminic acid synthetase